MPLLKKVSRKLRDVRTRLHVASRKSLARAVYSVPALKQHDPRRQLVTFKSQCTAVARIPDPGNASAPTDWYLALHGPETIRRTRSLSIDETQAAQFRAATQIYQSGESFEIPEVFLASVSRAKVLGQSLITRSRDHRIFVESALGKTEILEKYGVLDTVMRPRSGRLEGSYCLLGTPWSAAYYHWLLEALPRLALVEAFPELRDAKLIVGEPLNRFQREALRLAGVSEERVVVLDAVSTEIERLTFPQIPAPTGNPAPRAVAWLRRRLLPHSARETTTTRAVRKLYITRRDAPQRRLLNEDEVVPYVQSLGFEVVSLGDMSVAEQARLFSETNTIIAPHGAGVTNTLFCPPGATVVELFGTNYINGCFWALANLCGHRHAFLTGEPTGLDYRISLPQLKRLLARLGLN